MVWLHRWNKRELLKGVIQAMSMEKRKVRWQQKIGKQERRDRKGEKQDNEGNEGNPGWQDKIK